MNWDAFLPLLIVLSSLLVGLVIFFLPEERAVIRITLNLTGAVFKLILVGLANLYTSHLQYPHK